MLNAAPGFCAWMMSKKPGMTGMTSPGLVRVAGATRVYTRNFETWSKKTEITNTIQKLLALRDTAASSAAGGNAHPTGRRGPSVYCIPGFESSVSGSSESSGNIAKPA